MIEFFKSIGGPALLFGGALTFAATAFWTNRASKRLAAEKVLSEKDDLLARIAELETQLNVIGQAVTPLTQAMQAMLVKQLTHYHTPRMDELLAKLDPFTLSDEEENELFALLAQRTLDLNGRIPPIERIYAKALPLVIAMVRHDLSLSKAIDNLTVIAVPTKDESRNNETTIELKMIAVHKESQQGKSGSND